MNAPNNVKLTPAQDAASRPILTVASPAVAAGGLRPGDPPLWSLDAVVDATQPLEKPWGLRLEPEDDVEDVADRLTEAHLVEVTFPVLADGRGYTQAAHLRALGYTGWLRASGDIGADQVPELVGVGFDAIELRPGTVLDDARAALARFAWDYVGIRRVSRR